MGVERILDYYQIKNSRCCIPSEAILSLKKASIVVIGDALYPCIKDTYIFFYFANDIN
ncbi:MAG: hypothetical protein HZC47_00145 [Methanobacterium sp.]|uniref:hypothetical protein n=1 Tax=Methanobacterium sp. TaxID=2164 RepID=UPI003D64A4EE|nr:hypothetical protein [Methanobacterium sp.]